MRIVPLLLALLTALTWQIAPAHASPDRQPESAVVPVSTVLDLDPAAAEYPESVVYREGAAYLSLAVAGQVLKIDLATRQKSVVAQLPVVASNFTLGLAFDTDGNLFVAVGAADPTDAAGFAAAGIYQVPGGSGTPRLWASGETTLKYPSALAFDRRGNLYASDALAGAIYRFGPQGALGTATPWLSDPALTPDVTTCPAAIPFVLGVNGLVAEDGAVWAANTVQGTVLKISVKRSGEAGRVRTVVKNCSTLQGIDGLRVDPRSPRTHFLGAVNASDTTVSISRRGHVDVLPTSGAPLRTPVDLAPITDTRCPARVLVVNGSFAELLSGQAGSPSLVELELPPLRHDDRSHGRAR